MATQKQGTIVHWQSLSPILAIFRLAPENGSRFPGYVPGQYIALRRENCRLTRRTTDPEGNVSYAPDLDESGVPRYGSVTHSYSITSSPSETLQHVWLEFYVVLEKGESQYPGRFTESLFRDQPDGDRRLTYFDRITGDFILEKRGAGFSSVLLVGTGTGLAPFRSMIRQLHDEALAGKKSNVRYTLVHANRTLEELAYHQELCEIEASRSFDFVYVPSVSRPSPNDLNDPTLGKGRANNLLRRLFDMPLKEEEAQTTTSSGSSGATQTQPAVAHVVRPVFPKSHPARELRERFDSSSTVVLTCGNPAAMADIQAIASANQLRFEKEDW
jgi:ferredoxin-NADP reductase